MVRTKIDYGIDLGTTNSAVAVMENGSPKITALGGAKRTMPSVVAFTDEGEPLVGKPAEDQALQNPEDTVESIKRHIGEDGYTVEAGGDEYTPEQISAMVLKKIKRNAEESLGHEIEKAVITVPAYFNDRQRRATKDAGELAGFEVERIIDEPAAAAMAYGYDDESDQKVLVYDLGGGSFSVSVLDLGGGVFEIVTTDGDNTLGGDDWNQAIIEYLADSFEDEHGVDLRDDRQALRRLAEAAEEAKLELSSRTETAINLPFISTTGDGPIDLEQKLSRAEFESITNDLLEQTIQVTEQALDDAGYPVNDIDEVVLVGGSTRMPQVQNKIQEFTNQKPNKSVNPDEAVAKGAAVQGGVLSGKVDDIILLDVTPLSLGIEVEGGLFERLTEKNRTIPTAASKVFTTSHDDQTRLRIRIFQGEREIAAENELLGEFTLSNIPPAAAGVPQIEITLDIDENGIIAVEARNIETDDEESITIDELSDTPVTGSESFSQRSLPALASIEDRFETLLLEGPVEFENETKIIEKAADLESTTKLIDLLVDQAVDFETDEQLLTKLARGPGKFKNEEQLRSMLEKVIESEWDKEDEPFEFEDEEKLLETLVDGTIDIRNTLTRAQVYYQDNAHVTAPTDNHIQPITNQIEELLDYFPDDFDQETAAVPDEILRFYTALEDLRNRLQQSELTTANLDAGIKRLDETLHAAGYAVIDPDPGSTTDPYRHKVWSKTESELTEGRVVRVREVGYERDGNIKREAKVVVSSGTRPVPETIPSPPRRSFTYEDFDYEEPLGQGGNADVHRATIETDDGRLRLAIKTPRMKGTLHAEAVSQIVDEAKLWQQLDDHDHIVSVVDYGSEPLPWIGMEYMDGGHFGERIAGMDIRQKCWTALAITRAVRHAHDRGVAHLDLKPENILFREVEDAWDPPKVADWGLSKHLLDHSQSVEGISPQYAAPEQFDSEAYGNTDTATDIYQLGAVSYELFTERPPFTGQTFEIVNKIQNEHPAPPSEHADIPAALDEIILKALKRRKADRYEHVLYLRDDLKEVFESI